VTATRHRTYSGGEEVELIHRTLSRRTFADGALRAARFAAGAEPGLYSMDGVLAEGGRACNLYVISWGCPTSSISTVDVRAHGWLPARVFSIDCSFSRRVSGERRLARSILFSGIRTGANKVFQYFGRNSEQAPLRSGTAKLNGSKRWLVNPLGKGNNTVLRLGARCVQASRSHGHMDPHLRIPVAKGLTRETRLAEQTALP
jgi:hypothetical protein